MHKLTNYPNEVLAQMLIDRLQEYNIFCGLFKEVATRTLYGTGTTMVWIENPEDMELSIKLLEEFNTEIDSLVKDYKCKNCGYDLSGHSGDGVCPECGTGFYTHPEENTCSACGEQVPGNFVDCWNCGQPLGIYEDYDIDDEPEE